jgi:hypothetical protein
VLEIDTSGVEAYAAWLEQEAARITLDFRQFLHSWALFVHADITSLTPQWSGNLAANWALDVGAETTAATTFAGPAGDQPFKGGRGGGPMYSRGMQPAVAISLARARQARLPELSETVYIHNPVEYAEAVENDSGPLRVRAINRLPRTEAGKIAMVLHAYTKYSQTADFSYLAEPYGRS